MALDNRREMDVIHSWGEEDREGSLTCVGCCVTVRVVVVSGVRDIMFNVVRKKGTAVNPANYSKICWHQKPG